MLKRPTNAHIRKANADFMRTNHADQQARDNLLAEIPRRNIKTQGELIDVANRYGYNKTPRDRDVLQDVLKKSHLPDDHIYDRQRRSMERNMKKQTRDIMDKIRSAQGKEVTI